MGGRSKNRSSDNAIMCKYTVSCLITLLIIPYFQREMGNFHSQHHKAESMDGPKSDRFNTKTAQMLSDRWDYWRFDTDHPSRQMR